MNKITFPDWSLKYKTKGTSLRYSNGRIQLYKVPEFYSCYATKANYKLR